MSHTRTHNLFELHSPNGDGQRVASLNVKVRRVSAELAAIINDDEHAAEEFANFWWSTAVVIAGEFGFGVEQHGRSGGWAVFTLNGRAITADDLDTRGLDAIEGNARRSLAARLNRAAARVLDTLTDVALIDLAVDLGFEDHAAPSIVTVEDLLGAIDALDVRAAAAEYHDGMGSALYALSSTGTLTELLPREARAALKLAEGQAEWDAVQAFELLLDALDDVDAAS